MKCFNRFLSFVFGVVFFSLFFSFSFGVNNTFALDDLVFTSDNASYLSNPCPSCYSNGYRYVVASWESSSEWSTFSPFSLSYRIYGQLSTFNINGSSSSYFIISILPSIQFDTLSISTRFSSTVVRFTDTLPGDCPSPPSGSLSITENGTYDVTNYAEAVVDVPDTVIQGDYHDDLVSINHSILICGAVLLVLYFFYAIYRMLIKSTGGK